MRLKEDSDSWKSSGIIKRDFRHDNSDSFLRKKSSKKDTRKWCKGKVGVEHDFIVVGEMVLVSIRQTKWINKKCKNCGKKDIETIKQGW